MIKIGDTLQGRYAIVRPLGSGGFGSVFLATDGRLGGRQVAIKYFAVAHMRPDEAAASAQLFQSEAHILANLNHPNLAPVLDYFEVDDGWVLVMGYVPGDSLSSLQRRLNGPFGEDQVMDWAIELCNVLEYLHRQHPPLVFRDLKPSNIMRTPEGKVMLIDFGIVRTFKEGQHQDTVQLGTPGYAPPEQYGGQTEPRSDLYSLGATMYVLLTNERLTGGFAIPSVRDQSPWVSPPLDALISRLTALRPQERPASATAVRMELERIRSAPADQRQAASQDEAAPFGANKPADPRKQVPGGPAPNQHRSSPEAPTQINPNLPRRQGNVVAAPQSVSQQHNLRGGQGAAAPSQAAPPRPAPDRRARSGPSGWVIALLLVLLLGGAGGAIYAFRDTLFGGAQGGGISGDTPQKDSLAVIVSTQSKSGEGSYGLLELPIDEKQAPRPIDPGHNDNAIADRRADGKLVYTHGVEQDGRRVEQIFASDADGGNEQQLTAGPGVNRAPRWSPDGTQIIFESSRDQTASNPRDIYLMDANGANQTRITAEEGWQGGPAWSPDGTKIVYHTKTTPRYELAVLDLGTGEQATLVKIEGEDCFWPDWSPDGKTVAFMTGAGDQTAIYTIPKDGGTPRRLDNLGDGVNRWPRWSPDGRYLAFESQRDGLWQVFVLGLDDQQVRPLSDGTRNDRWPMW